MQHLIIKSNINPNYNQMKTNVKISPSEAAKIANNKKAKSAKKKAPAKVKKSSEYKAQVLGVNSKLKAEQKTLGGAIKMLLLFRSDIGLDNRRTKVLRFIQKDDAAYKSFKGLVRTSKKGNYCAFYVLQALNKNLNEYTK